MMKTYAPKDLAGSDLRGLLSDLLATPAQAAKYLRVTERSVWRWLSDESAPFAVLAALWHETPRGREVAAADVGNLLTLTRSGQRIAQAAAVRSDAALAALLRIADTGAANDPLMTGPASKKPQLPRLSRLTLDPGAAPARPAAGFAGLAGAGGGLGLESPVCCPAWCDGESPADSAGCALCGGHLGASCHCSLIQARKPGI